MLRLLYLQGKNPKYPLDRRPESIWMLWKRDKSLSLVTGHPACSASLY
jgi:hypothetical protein